MDIVLLTHLHADHVGGLATSQGTRLFPRAVVHMAKADSDFWLSERIAQQAPREAQEFFTLAPTSAPKVTVDFAKALELSAPADHAALERLI